MEPEKNIQNAQAAAKRPLRNKRYPKDFKLRIIKIYLEESVPLSLLCRESGVCKESVRRWVRSYRKSGESGLYCNPSRSSRRGLPEPVLERIVSIKKANPGFGIKRISQMLRRVFFLSASPETVRKTLHGSSLMSPPSRKKSQRNITRPRFFERSTPNQLWQTDIFTFRLGGRYAFLIGYIDDYSRYMTGLDLFRSQTSENVIEVYRRAASEYNPPKEMLTDNGRQYTTWRGTSRFEAEMQKDRIHHIKSQPHHPMTLGKIERFWKSIFQEFLSRAQFDSFEDAQDRIRHWVKYYNHKRPHQGIGGLCPADRYFEIQSELRKTMERGIQENLLEMALRGKPRLPFYMVGRMEGQSVVLRAEKGKLRLSVDDADETGGREVVYDLNDKGENHGEAGEGEKREETGADELRSDGEMPVGAFDLDGAAQARGGMPGAIGAVDGAVALAEAGDGGNASGAHAEDEPGKGPCPKPTPADASGEQAANAFDRSGAGAASKQAFESSGEREAGSGGCLERGEESLTEGGYGAQQRAERGSSPAEGLDRHAGSQRAFDGRGGRQALGCVEEDLLRMGNTGSAGDDAGDGGEGRGQASAGAGCGEGAVAG
jgi:transposase InsO family protein